MSYICAVLPNYSGCLFKHLFENREPSKYHDTRLKTKYIIFSQTNTWTQYWYSSGFTVQKNMCHKVRKQAWIFEQHWRHIHKMGLKKIRLSTYHIHPHSVKNRDTNRLDTAQPTSFIFLDIPEKWTEACKRKCMDDTAASSMEYSQLKATQFSSVSQTPPPSSSLLPPFPSLLASPSAPIFTCCCHQGNRQFKKLLLSNGRQYPASSRRDRTRKK